jgi:hypothetical protein
MLIKLSIEVQHGRCTQQFTRQACWRTQQYIQRSARDPDPTDPHVYHMRGWKISQHILMWVTQATRRYAGATRATMDHDSRPPKEENKQIWETRPGHIGIAATTRAECSNELKKWIWWIWQIWTSQVEQTNLKKRIWRNKYGTTHVYTLIWQMNMHTWIWTNESEETKSNQHSNSLPITHIEIILQPKMISQLAGIWVHDWLQPAFNPVLPRHWMSRSFLDVG